LVFGHNRREPALQNMSAIDATWPVDPSTMGAPLAPRAIGRFVVMDVLGQGAMGLVLAAYDPDLDRKVALKLLRPGAFGSEADAAERMLREARAMAKLSHPNVLAIHETGKLDGQIFLAMEFAPGGTLRAWCEEPRPWRDVLGKFVQAGRGLEAAHEAGLVHRDFKPTNVLLGKSGEARVADFGLVGVNAIDGEVGELDITLTATGTLLGTPAYMAPEQHERGDVGPAADQFAFCVSLWEALHRVPPFAGTTVRAIAENVRAHRVIAPPDDSAVPVWLTNVLRRGLAIAPEERWPSMHALLDELAHDPAIARRRRVRWLGGAVAGMIAVAGSIAAVHASVDGPTCEHMDRSLAGVWDAERAAVVRAAFGDDDTFQRVAATLDAYTSAWVTARRTACEATHVHGDQSTELLDRKVACLDRRLVAVDALVDLLATPTPEVRERALGAALRLPSLTECANPALSSVIAPPVDAETRSVVERIRADLAAAKALGDTGQYKAGRARAIELAARAEALGYAPALAEALYRRGHLEMYDGEAALAVTTFEQALLAAADAHDDLLAAEILSDSIYVLGDQLQRPADALRLRAPAEAALRRAGGDRETAANLDANLARVLQADGKFAASQALLERAIATKEQLTGRDSFDVARALTSLGNALYEQGKYDEALARHERAVAIWRAAFGDTHPDVLGVENNIANVQHSTRDYAGARARYERILAGLIERVGPDHPRIGDLNLNLGNTLVQLGEHAAAIACFERAIAIYVAAYGETNADVADTYNAIGNTHYETDHYAEALRAFERAVSIREALEHGSGADVTYPLIGVAETLLIVGRADAALPHAERAMKIRDAVEVLEADRIYARMLVGHVLFAAGRDRTRARTLVGDARAYYANAGEAGARRLSIADQILAKYDAK
jgi:tetratricopeptide (TPR) repeat protein